MYCLGRMKRARQGWEGWDTYAPFYDWENARTLGRRDVPFWRTVALNVGGPLLELGAGTGRISLPLGRAGVSVVGIDRSEPMLARARQRILRAKPARRLTRGRGARDAHRDGASGPEEGPHDFRPGVPRAPRHEDPNPPVLAGVPDPLGSANGAPAGKGGVCGLNAAGRLQGPRVGSSGRRLGH